MRWLGFVFSFLLACGGERAPASSDNGGGSGSGGSGTGGSTPADDCARGSHLVDQSCVATTVTGFSEQQVSFPGADFTLEGVLTLPESDAERHPGVVLVHGSGPNSRDEVSSGQLLMAFGKEVRVFETLAQQLALRGFAVLRYDKRTCITGNGCDNSYPLPDPNLDFWAFRDDAEAAVAWLSTQPQVRPDDVTPMGHSQGGQVVPFIDHEAVVDVALLASPYSPVDASLAYQLEFTRNLLQQVGQTPAQIDAATADLQVIVDEVAALRAGTFGGTTIAGVPIHFWQEWMDAGDATAAQVAAHDGGVLVIQGDYDWNVPPSEAALFEAALEGHADASVQLLPELTHPFVRVAQPDWMLITAGDIGDDVDAAFTTAVGDWLLR
jgi:uncharacterized protein